jgi:hypothetical protein
MDIRLAIQLTIIFTSLLSIMFSFNYYVHYRVLALNRPFQREENRRRYRAALLLLAFSALIFIAAMSSLVAGAGRGGQATQNPGLTATPSGEQLQVAPSVPAATPAPSGPAVAPPIPSATPTPVLRRARIGNTNGFGANMRTAPGVAAEIVATLSDDTQVKLTDAIQEAGGYTWQLIITDDGREGWVADIFLIPEE